MKKWVCLLSVVLLLVTMFTPTAFGASLSVGQKVPASMIVEELSEDQYLEGVASITNEPERVIRSRISGAANELIKGMGASADEEIRSTSSGKLVYMRVTSTKDFSSGTALSSPVEIGMYFTVYEYGSFRQINSIDGCWTGETGSGPYTWKEFAKVTYPASFPTIAIEAHARGAVETVVDTSISGGVELKNALLGAGFSVTAQVGTKLYLRKVDDLFVNFRLYWY